jgi:hypothetical protein
MQYSILNETPIKLSHFEVRISDILKAVELTNSKFKEIHVKTSEMNLDLFTIIDFRVLSGLMGETFSSELSKVCPELVKNPSLDGYPDLLQASTKEMRDYIKTCRTPDFIKYKYGGIEVKNTFGTKKGSIFIGPGETRIGLINGKLDWKAHHQETNNLIGLFSDYVDAFPKIAALTYADNLTRDDWSAVQRPKGDSAMTSFSAITGTGYSKLVQGIRLCYNDERYLSFFKRK